MSEAEAMAAISSITRENDILSMNEIERFNTWPYPKKTGIHLPVTPGKGNT